MLVGVTPPTLRSTTASAPCTIGVGVVAPPFGKTRATRVHLHLEAPSPRAGGGVGWLGADRV